MIKIGFIDYYLDEWHANNYPAWIKEASEGEMEVCYCYGEIDAPNGLTNAEWAEKFGVTLCSSIDEVIEKKVAKSSIFLLQFVKNRCMMVQVCDNTHIYGIFLD